MPARGRRQEHGGTTMTKSPWIAAALVASLLSMGPLAPLMTLAEAQQMQPAPPPMQVQPPQPPVMGPSEPPLTSQVPGQEAVPVNPGKALICLGGAVTSTILMLLTFGSAYRSARGVFQEGCSPPWALTADHVSGKIPGPGDPGYDPAARY